MFSCVQSRPPCDILSPVHFSSNHFHFLFFVFSRAVRIHSSCLSCYDFFCIFLFQIRFSYRFLHWNFSPSSVYVHYERNEEYKWATFNSFIEFVAQLCDFFFFLSSHGALGMQAKTSGTEARAHIIQWNGQYETRSAFSTRSVFACGH